MSENKTVKYHIPEQGIYLYARSNENKTEMIILNSTGREQVLPSSHYNVLTKESKEGKIISTGEKISFAHDLTLAAHQSLIIEF